MDTTPYAATPAAMLSEQACRDLVAKAALRVDSQDYAAFAELFLPDGVLQRPGAAPLVGRAAIVSAYTGRPATRLTRHLVTNIVVTLEADTRAHATSYVLLWSGDTSAEETPFGRAAHPRQVVGQFADQFERVGDQWLIAHRAASFVLFAE